MIILGTGFRLQGPILTFETFTRFKLESFFLNSPYSVLRRSGTGIALLSNVETKPNFFSHVTESLAKELGTVLSQPSGYVFKRYSEVKVGKPTNQSKEGYHLYPVKVTLKPSDVGTFYEPIEEDMFLMFREPSHVSIKFALHSKGMTVEKELNTFDELSSFFFDKRSLKPFLPDYYKSYPSLEKRLRSKRAEIVALNEQDFNLSDDLVFKFQYSALYHTGKPLKQTGRVQHRVVNYQKKTEEQRSS